MNAATTVRTLRAAGQDFEWYPTTDEILHALWNDLRTTLKGRDEYNSYHSSASIRYCTSFRPNEPNRISIPRMLDIGTGDGRVFTTFPAGFTEQVMIEKRLGIEKSDHMADVLIAKGVWLLGRDYMHTTLIGKQFDVVFSNPPYSIFKEWCVKLVSEVSAKFVYLVIPERWENDAQLKAAMSERFDIFTVGHYDFSQGDREARAKVSLLRLESKSGQNEDDSPFRKWIKETIGEFKAAEKEPEIKERNHEPKYEVGTRKSAAASLLESYQQEMLDMVTVYRTLSGIDFELLKRLGISYDGVVKRIQEDIQAIKYRYWEKAFGAIDALKKRLTVSTAKELVGQMQEFRELDFNEDNILNIVTWIVQNINAYSVRQLNKVYDDLTDFEQVRAYKSNDVWLNDKWRYGKKVQEPSKYMLDYRIVVSSRSVGIEHFAERPDSWQWEWRPYNDNIIADLAVIANSLGFPNEGIQELITFAKQHSIKDAKGKELFAYRIYRNGNVHFKIRQDFMRVLNVEVGRLRGWLKSPSDVETEFEVSREEAEKLFNFPKLQLVGASNVRLLE